MVAVIKTGYSVHRIMNYNENKVNEGVARCIGAGNYPMEPEYMSFTKKLNYLRDQLELNQRSKRTSVHVSLNFDPSESGLSEDRLMQIADGYMDRIGFGHQPYLVYQHFDAGHPHIHIVSINIQRDTSRIDMTDIGKLKSEPARRELEIEHGLVRADDHSARLDYRPEPINISAVEYGRLETKKAIQNVLEHVLAKYKYTSLPELNALLSRYNVMAQQGAEGSRVKLHDGLLYRIIDEHGNPVGVPIKASAFYNRPTMSRLQGNFDRGALKRLPFRTKLRTAIDLVLMEKGISLKSFVEQLSQKGIDVVFRKNDEEFIFGITYVDHVSKTVFNGSSLGKNYSAKAIQERCTSAKLTVAAQEQKAAQHHRHNNVATTNQPKTYGFVPNIAANWKSRSFMHELIDGMTQLENTTEYIPYELTGKKKKRKKRK